MNSPILDPRCRTRQIRVGAVPVGGNAPISVQSMTKTDTRDVAATIAQIADLELAGCDIVRVAVPDAEAARALAQIKKSARIPVVADIHFDHKLALAAIDAGVDGLRINPGNLGGADKLKEIVRAAEPRKVPIRVGINSGSLEEDILRKHGNPVPEALVESALRNIRAIEDLGYREVKASVKAPTVNCTVAAYRLLAERTDCPLHLGVTEAGTFVYGTVRSTAALAILLSEGIGDTIRISLSDTPQQEVKVGLALLRALGLREPGASVIACPTCGRTELNVIAIANELEEKLEKYYRQKPGGVRPVVAVMGCVVNGPGEARHADVAVCGGKGKAALFVKGVNTGTIAESRIVEAVLAAVARLIEGGNIPPGSGPVDRTKT